MGVSLPPCSSTANYDDSTQNHRKSFIDFDISVVAKPASCRSVCDIIFITIYIRVVFTKFKIVKVWVVDTCSIVFFVAHSLVLMND